MAGPHWYGLRKSSGSWTGLWTPRGEKRPAHSGEDEAQRWSLLGSPCSTHRSLAVRRTMIKLAKASPSRAPTELRDHTKSSLHTSSHLVLSITGEARSLLSHSTDKESEAQKGPRTRGQQGTEQNLYLSFSVSAAYVLNGSAIRNYGQAPRLRHEHQ